MVLGPLLVCYTETMKQTFAIIGIIIVLIVILFGLSLIAPSAPAEKVGTQGYDEALVEACNSVLTQVAFANEEESDMFMSACLNGEIDLTELGVVLEGPAETFTGTLTEVNTGCFADGECYVMVDGKHVTLLRGWSQDTVGSVIGGDNSIGGLEAFIGSEVEVYAKKTGLNAYTLYGDAAYYVKVK